MSEPTRTENPMTREKRFAVRAGIFVFSGLLVAGLVIFLIGKERRLFDRHFTFRGAFENVDGLKLDSPVRLGGLDVGRVSSITFAPDLGDKRIVVHMEISERFAERVREDSVARVTSRGVLGDKAIDISLGSPEAKRIVEGGEIETGSSGDLSSLLKASGEIIDNSVAITRDLKQAIAAYTDPEIRRDVASVVKSVRSIAQEIETGQGTVHALLYDRATTQEFRTLLSNASSSATRLNHAIAQVESVLREVQEGEGVAHAVFYDKRGSKAIGELGQAASELASLVHDAKQSPNGAVHQLIYGDAREIFANLGTAAADIRGITAKVKAGEGTIGALLNDPTVYEDLKTVLGNVKRNRILRALVRYSISNHQDLQSVGKPESGGPGSP